jgi:RNA polymerase sigma-70 factor (ECF subfamily)
MQSQIKEIIEQVKEGNKTAFKYLVEEYQKYAFNLAFRILCNEEDAKDVVQDSFIKIWKNIKQFNSGLKFTTWMYRIVINTAIDKHRSLIMSNVVQLDGISNSVFAIERDGPEARLNNEQLGNLIEEISGELPEKQRMVFVLRDLQGIESGEVETILGMNETLVKSNLYHARQVVRKKLEKIWDLERRR